MNLTNLGGRRFLLTVGCGIVCTALLWAGKLDATNYRDLILGTVAAYIVGNTWQKQIEARADAAEKAGAP
jgi:hypothetical protein